MHREVIGRTEFIFRQVESPNILEEVYRLRYQVYCKECKFIKEEDYPEGLERDKYDDYSLHFVAEDKDGIIGSARMILDSPLVFPLEEHCNGFLTIDKESLPRKSLAEISRLVISKDYRRRRGDALYYSPEFDDKLSLSSTDSLVTRIRPMAFGIYREIYQESKRRGIIYWYALMEKTLWMLLRLHNFIFEPIGEEIDFYGPVRPYLGKIERMEEEVQQRSPHIFKYFLDGLEPEYRPKSIL